MTPSVRRPLGVLALLVGLFAYMLGVVWLFEPVASLNALVQLPIWLILGIAWVVPVRPLLIWMETGRWRR